MSKQISEMTLEDVANLELLGLDDSFEVHCKACGKCCKQREDILLTPYDLFRLATFFGRTPEEIVERYCEVYQGDTSHMPCVRILPVPPDNACPFLRGKRCAVHDRKPVLCRTFPLARVHLAEKSGYYFQGSNCNVTPRSTTVREWIADVASEEAEQVGRLWVEMVAKMHPLINPENKEHHDKVFSKVLPKLNVSIPTDDAGELTEKLKEQLASVMFNATFHLFYLRYDIKAPFVPQFQQNFNELIPILEGEAP